MDTESTNVQKAKLQYDKMTKTPVGKLVASLAVPTILSMLSTTIYNLVDTAFVGTLGTSQSGAVGIVFGFMSILQAFGFTFGQGGGNLLSRSLGAKDIDAAKQSASTAFFASFVTGIICTILCFIFLDPLISILGSTETIAPYAKDYLKYLLLTAPFAVSSFSLNNMLRYEGKATLGMIGLIIGGVLNIGGDALFMFVFDMGIAGAGLSTALSQVISFSILLSMFLTKKTQSRLSLKYFTLENGLLLNIIGTGFPSLLRQGLAAISTVLINTMSAKYAFDEGVAAMSIVSRIAFFLFSIVLGIGQGFQPVCSFNYGAGKYERVRKAYRFTFIMGEIVIIILTVFAMFFSNGLVRLFRDDPKVIEIGTTALRILLTAQLLLPICMFTEMLMQCCGKKKYASILSSLRGGIILIPLLIILPYLFEMMGVMLSQPLSYVLSVFPSLYLMRKFFRELPR